MKIYSRQGRNFSQAINFYQDRFYQYVTAETRNINKQNRIYSTNVHNAEFPVGPGFCTITIPVMVSTAKFISTFKNS